MARKKGNSLTQLWGSFNTLTKLFFLTAVASIIVATLFVQKQQDFIQEASRGMQKYTINLLTSYPVFAGNVYFHASGRNISTGDMWLFNQCKQNGSIVYQQYLKISSDGNSGPFTLGPTPTWSGGEAECMAIVESFSKGSFRPLESITYIVAP
jgi:hypothetical protein